MNLPEVGIWVKSKTSTPFVRKKWALVLICGFCKVPLISVFMTLFQFDGNLNP